MSTDAPTARPPLRFRFNLLLTLIALVMLGILISLGTWQTGRYFEKTENLAQYHKQHIERPPVTSLGEGAGPDRIKELHMRRVELTGLLEMEHAQLLTARFKLGKPGYNVIAPLKAEGGPYPRIIVNIGWVPSDKLAEYLKQSPSQRVSVHGRIQVGDNEADDEPAGETEGLRTWRRINTVGLARVIPGLDPDLMILAGEEASGQTIRLEDFPLDGYPPPERQPPSKNVEYAATWFGLAGTLIAVYLAFSLRRAKPTDEAAS